MRKSLLVLLMLLSAVACSGQPTVPTASGTTITPGTVPNTDITACSQTGGATVESCASRSQAEAAATFLWMEALEPANRDALIADERHRERAERPMRAFDLIADKCGKQLSRPDRYVGGLRFEHVDSDSKLFVAMCGVYLDQITHS